MAVAETVRVEVAEPPFGILTLVGLSEPVRPEAGEIKVDSDTVPVKPFWLETVIFEVDDCPGNRLIELGMADTAKLGGALPDIVKLSL